jgi:phage/plasmid-associated DNA primase
VPAINLVDGGTLRRLRTVACDTQFVDNPDPAKPYQRKKKEVNKEELKYGVLSILLDAYDSDIETKHILPEKMVKNNEIYVEENNTYKRFIDEFFEKTGDNNDIIRKTDMKNTISQNKHNYDFKLSNERIRDKLISEMDVKMIKDTHIERGGVRERVTNVIRGWKLREAVGEIIEDDDY